MNKPHKSRNSEPNKQSPRNIFEIFSCSWAFENFSHSRGLRTDISQKKVVGCPCYGVSIYSWKCRKCCAVQSGSRAYMYLTYTGFFGVNTIVWDITCQSKVANFGYEVFSNEDISRWKVAMNALKRYKDNKRKADPLFNTDFKIKPDNTERIRRRRKERIKKGTLWQDIRGGQPPVPNPARHCTWVALLKSRASRGLFLVTLSRAKRVDRAWSWRSSNYLLLNYIAGS